MLSPGWNCFHRDRAPFAEPPEPKISTFTVWLTDSICTASVVTSAKEGIAAGDHHRW
jgi:hypothetical protein